jgi:hypothetical protein
MLTRHCIAHCCAPQTALLGYPSLKLLQQRYAAPQKLR